MIERAALAMTLISLGVGTYFALTRLHLTALTRSRETRPLLNSLRDGVPAIIYFWSDSCPPCRTVQRPAIEQVQDELGDAVQVVMVNAAEDQQTAAAWGVLSLPTTIIIDSAGEVAHINHGVARADQLHKQLTGQGNANE